MAETLPYPDVGEGTGVGPDRGATTGTSSWQKVVGILGVVVVLWVGSEMYDVMFFRGVVPGPGHDTPVPSQDQDGDPAPPDDGPHDPSQFDH